MGEISSYKPGSRDPEVLNVMVTGIFLWCSDICDLCTEIKLCATVLLPTISNASSVDIGLT